MSSSFGQHFLNWHFHPSLGSSAAPQWPRSFYRGNTGFYNQPESVGLIYLLFNILMNRNCFLALQYLDDQEDVDEPVEEVYGRSKLQLKNKFPFNKFNQRKVQQDDARQFIPTRSTATMFTTSYAATSTVTIPSTAICFSIY